MCLRCHAIGPDEFYPNERDALIQLRESVKSSLNLHLIWTGPPCQDNKSRWVGIACSNGHVIHIVLDGYQLTGSLPPTFLQNITYLSKLSLGNNSILGSLPNLGGLVYLKLIFLSDNKFSGSIPLEYVNLPKLKRLELQENYLMGNIPPFDQPSLTTFNISSNFLEGPIPQTPVLQKFPENSYSHNLELCGKPLGRLCPNVSSPPVGAPPPSPNLPEKKEKALKVWTIVLIGLATALVPFMVMFLFLCHHRRVYGKENDGDNKVDGSAEWPNKKMQNSGSTGDPERIVELDFFDKERPVFDLDDLLRASAEMLGKGRLGSTYKAILESGSVVAVKRLKEMNGLEKKEFVQQMQLLGRLAHENVVKIISFYYAKDEKLVIYEYVSHASLFELLHDNHGPGRIPLDWASRLSIVKGIAKGLTYLHQSLPSHKVPHANLKSSNILIHHSNHNYQATLVDFGFLPLLRARSSSRKLAVGRCPEFLQGKKLTHKADVYCFGIILLEVITGRNPSISKGDGDDDLSDWVRLVVENDWSTDILDLEILPDKGGHNKMLKLTEIALECTDAAPEKRPKMSFVFRKIEELEQENPEQEDVERI
ncbi:hypothetical protein GIB67_020784 [Kingdonia uniflora]|uniref:Protein kinase domain-containing protein n=1 Tax=Kingdonia uniflora TaxID=39325 RepID=A0A7J7M734_9MAGN|nr:hypothetical protein GIB67_020784 [Kingdonia uniflora]